MIKTLLRNVWLLFFIIAIFIFLFSTFQTITFSSIGAPQFAVYSIGPLLIIGSSYLHLNYVTKLISLIQIIIYLAIAVIFIKLPEMLEEYGHFLLFPVITNFYSSWCALIWHTNSKMRKLTISIVSIFYIFSLITVSVNFSNDILNKITLLLGILSLLISIISSFFLRKFLKDKIKPGTKSEGKEDAQDHLK